MNKMIHTQLERIVKQLAFEEEDEQYREVAIWLINENETSVNFIVDLKHFKFEANDKWLYIEWDGGSKEDTIIYSHAIKVDQIAYITSEV